MQEVFNFIFSHYEAILSVLTLIISVVVLILRKKPVSSVQADIFGFALLAVKEVEKQQSLNSYEKLQYAISLVEEALLLKYPNISCLAFRSLIVKTIEDILSTPHKKGDK